MIDKGRRFLVAALVGAAGTLTWPVVARSQPLPPAPVPVLPSVPVPVAPGESGPMPPPPSLGAPVVAPSPPPQPPAFDQPFPPPAGGCITPAADSAWFFGVELDFLKPQLKNQLTGTATFPDGTTDTFQTPSASLPWTVAPRFEVGYNFGDDFGSLSAAYRFLVPEGKATVAEPAGAFDVRSRLSLNQFDFDYTSGRYSPAPFWDLKWRVGARVADVFFDSRADDGVLNQQASSNFIGAGPHFGVDAERRIGLLPGLALYGGADGAVLIGQMQQHFHEGIDGASLFGEGEQRRTQTVPTINLQAGFRYAPPRMDFLHFTAGYEFEQWWNIGRIGASRGELTGQGVFLRGELDY